MALLVPDRNEIISLPTPLQEGEKALMELLLKTLDDDWTIYVQPHLNGLNPDIVIFSPDAGIGVFEVKDWRLNSYRVENTEYGYQWSVYDKCVGSYVHMSRKQCPFWQVKRYKDSIFQYEIPFLGAETTFERRLYALLTPFLYFHEETTANLKAFFEPIPRDYRYVSYFGYDDLNPPCLLQLLKSRHLRKGSVFAHFMKDNNLLGQLRSALSYPKYGKFDRKHIQILTAKQRELLPNNPGGRRVLGVAGSGKTIVVINKAVAAAREDKKVLVVCFNIMMATLIKESIYRLARMYGPNVHRNIEVAHYHRVFRNNINQSNISSDYLMEEDDSFDANRYMKEPVDVLLIDEGQDFEREWVENLQRLCAPNYHFMFFEDDRQDIYLQAQTRRKLVLPGVSGRPILLNRTHRIPSEIAELANRLAEWASISNESGPIDIGQARPQRLFVSTKWFNGNCTTSLEALLSDVEFMWDEGSFGAPADTAILVCTVKAGWQVYERLSKSPIGIQTNFERREQHEELQRLFGEDREKFKRELDEVRRGYKTEFRMRTDKLKICTIHSFKGWELDRILVFFDPNKHQPEAAASLLYTAITRTQNSLTVYNSYPPFFEFGQIAINERLAEEWHSPK